MRRMYSEAQLIALIQQYGGQVSPEDIQEMFDDGDVSLIGKYARIMDAPSSTTLNDEQIEVIKGGVFINGTFLGYTNPILLPPYSYNNNLKGVLIANKYVTPHAGNFIIQEYSINLTSKTISLEDEILKYKKGIETTLFNKRFPLYPANTSIGKLISRKGTLEWYIPVAQDNITSGDVVATTSDLGKALIDHLDVEINGFRARYEYTSGNYVVYSSKSEVESGAKLQINMISYNTTNGELSFNQMTFTPDN